MEPRRDQNGDEIEDETELPEENEMAKENLYDQIDELPETDDREDSGIASE